MCNTLIAKFYYPLVVVGLVAVVVVHVHVLEAVDNLETYLNEFIIKKTCIRHVQHSDFIALLPTCCGWSSRGCRCPCACPRSR